MMTLSNDLLSYSIMRNGEKAVSHASPHYAYLADTKLPTVSLPPINSYMSLTENNLNLFNSFLHRLSSAGSTPPLLTLLSLVLDLPFGSPRIANSTFSDASDRCRVENSPISSRTHSVASGLLSGEKKRRQRLGPSCDNCRARKVKCDADVVLLSRHFTCDRATISGIEQGDIQELSLLNPSQKQALLTGEPVHTDSNYVLVLSNFKLIKYKPCTSCASKSFACCFSKGFTKEDIVHSKRHTGLDDSGLSKSEKKSSISLKVHKRSLHEGSPLDGASAKLSSRKSSCGACRKRKVKCVVVPHGKCVGCAKKDILCTF